MLDEAFSIREIGPPFHHFELAAPDGEIGTVFDEADAHFLAMTPRLCAALVRSQAFLQEHGLADSLLYKSNASLINKVGAMLD